MIQLHNLSKRYGAAAVVREVDLYLPQGSAYGLLGPNGAGKTTLLKLMQGLARPTSGRAGLLGHDVVRAARAPGPFRQLRQQVAWVPQQKALYPGLRVAQFVRYYAGFYPDADPDVARSFLAAWGVAPDQPTDHLSPGTCTKVLLACALARNPAILLLDEPTEGLDPETTEAVLTQLVLRAGPEGCAMVIATHRIDVVERICDRVGVMAEGRLLVSGRIDDLKAAWKHIHLRAAVDAAEIARWPGVVAVDRGPHATLVTTSQGDDLTHHLAARYGHAFEVYDMNLREIYLALVARKDPDAHAVVEDLV